MKNITTILLFFLTFVVFTSCGSKPVDNVDEATVANDFIRVYFTSDKDGRYTEYTSYDDWEDIAAAETHITDFYSCVKDLVSDDFLNKLMRQRRIFAEDKAAYDSGITTYPENIEIVEYSATDAGKVYSFTLDLVRTGASNDIIKVTGQIGVADGKITSFYSNTSSN